MRDPDCYGSGDSFIYLFFTFSFFFLFYCHLFQEKYSAGEQKAKTKHEQAEK